MQNEDNSNSNLGSPMDDSFEDAEQQQIRQRRIMEDSRSIPIFFNGRLIFNAIIMFAEGTGLQPINIRKWLQQQLTFFHNGDKTATPIDRVRMYCLKGLLFLDYMNDDPKLNSRLRIHSWPLQHVLGMRVKRAAPTPEQIAAYQLTKARPLPPPTRFIPASLPDRNMNQYEIEDDMDTPSDSDDYMEPTQPDLKKKNLMSR